MASVTATWSPSSLQLRLALSCGDCTKRQPSPMLVRMRRVRVLCCSAQLRGGRNVSCRVGSKAKADGFSGWAGSDEEESPDEHKRKWSGGLVGAGVAGVILASGIAFAAFSSRKPGSYRLKQQMEPLTTEQQVALVSDDENDGYIADDDEQSNTDSSVPTEKAGTNKDYSSSPEIDESPTLYRVGNEIGEVSVQDTENTLGGTDAINSTSIQDDLQHEATSGDKSVEPETLTTQFILPESDRDNVGAPGLEDSDSSLALGTGDLTSELTENPISIEPNNLPFSDSNISNLSDETQDGIPAITETQTSTSEAPTALADESSEPIALGVSVSTESITFSKPQILSKDNLAAVASPSTIENLDLSETVQAEAEGNSSSLEVHTIIESESSATSVPEPAYTNANEHYTNYSSDTNRSKSQLPNPRYSFSSAGIPAPTVVSAAVQVLPGKVLVPAVVDLVQGQALSALQVLKVIEADVQPGDLCTRREYARWLVSASSILSRNSVSKVYPAMYIENITELAFDDITPEDPDFPSIQVWLNLGLSQASCRDVICFLLWMKMRVLSTSRLKEIWSVGIAEEMD